MRVIAGSARGIPLKAPAGMDTRPTVDKVKEAVATAIMSLAESVDLEEQGCYLAPSVTSEDEALKTACETMNKYVGAKITYKFGDKAETLNGNEIHNWLTVNGTSVSVSESKAAE